MYMLKSVVSVAIFAAAAIAQSSNLQFTSFPPTTVAAGSPITLSWIGGDSAAPVTITLKKGLSTDLKDVGVISSTATGGSYTWTPDTSITNGADYALAISQGSVINYTGQFSVTGGTKAAATTASASHSASTPAPASSSAASSPAAASTTGTITPVGAAISTTPSSSNGTVSSATLSPHTNSTASASGSSTLHTSGSTRTATSTGSTASSSTVPATGGASGLQSPIALFFGVVAAMLYLQ